jgi:hypothetical protein
MEKMEKTEWLDIRQVIFLGGIKLLTKLLQ